MKNSRLRTRRFVALALVALAATSTFAQGPGGFGRPGGPPPERRGGPPRLDRLPPLAMLATRPEVAAELELRDDQIAQIETLLRQARPPRGERGPGDRPGEGREAAEADLDAKVKAVLGPGKAQRLTEIGIQLMGLSAAMVPAIQAKLGLSDAQKTTLDALLPTRSDRGPGGPPPGDGQGPGRGGRGPGDPRDGRRERLEAKIAAILTESQKATLKALGGKKIDLRERGPEGPPPDGGMGGPPF